MNHRSNNSLVQFRKELSFSYNPNNELIKTELKLHKGSDTSIITTHYYYDAFGRRIHKQSNNSDKGSTQSKTTLTLWDGGQAIQEYTDTHVFTTIYDQGSFAPVARAIWLKDDDNQLMQVYYYHNDQLGTPNELTNTEGKVVWLADYEAWGDINKEKYVAQNIGDFQIAANELQPIRFQGQVYDDESGLHYNRFRYYDPDIGMFISRDPIGLMGGDNVFAYAPNPTGWVDPLGLSVTSVLSKAIRGGSGLLWEAVKPKAAGACSDGSCNQDFIKMANKDRSISRVKDIEDSCTGEYNNNDCKQRLSDWQISEKGLDAHDIKHGILGKTAQVSLYELCKCKDNSIVIRHKGCKGPIIPTWEYY